ncbi:hypothetical protein P168DRAFT_324321 [Aspergillus campestris IBT 28561]|uniref:chitinase n=1 Tax=Aspergillus campestris (strain IBT 28561) TaxID=1392248 RepID=A0A2I1DHJ6_ASPC2|nr:uncharacterized protein P168DRAFT_324321 [Aspergillus campestris IBT 28561]PKY09339.1 hypothetical protein P168DRAFT_324321 [Aspergillus campestris IBT 28561]
MDSGTPESLFQEVTAIKSMKSGLAGSPVEVWISIGGWTFSNNDTDTQPVFGDISRSDKKRQDFADNLVAFMTRYGFDGVDLDWEYPGATDRGGKEDDTENFVKLMETLKETFKRSSRGGYGLTFTVPSSYWYLRWFDVPKMLDAGADWVNLMSYDLHGVWDQDNPIGSYVHGHTNLTEIKESVNLLWRNKVPPEKVILGTGFYGRSFQLNDTSCTTPGCPFNGAAEKGECTGEGGILGWFEIKEIMKSRNISQIHDEEAAVNYFTFDENQWVSYDDAKTFQQKVDWANSVGLGGLMAWAIDLDDEDFTELGGLIGRDPGKGVDKSLVKREQEAASWSSDNGQECYATACGEKCKAEEVVLEDNFISNCHAKIGKQICCPRDRAPRSCRWRGGKDGSFCHGQCHNGELTLLLDGYGDFLCTTGRQAFCCTADRYKELLDGCSLGSCGGSCSKGTTEVAKQYDFGSCWNHAIHGYKRPWCCKKPLKDCHWVGKGSCDDNNCDNDDVQLSLSGYGDSATLCGVAGRKKSLCCAPPDNVELFTPVALENLFPDPPPETDSVKWDLQFLGGYANNGQTTPRVPITNPNDGAFGFVLITGPKDIVSSLSKRDGSHVEFVDCPSITSSERQKTRLICTTDEEDSNCDDILDGGLEGTVVRMPDNCGPGSYAVAHSLSPSGNQTLPPSLTKRMASSRKVMDLEFSYDFTLMKRSDEKVQLRVDYSNLPGYWDTVVDEPGEKSKRDIIDKRFFSSDSASWGRKFDRLSENHIAYYTDLSEPASEVIIDEQLQCGGDSYLQIESQGTCTLQVRFGFTIIGTLQPLHIDEAYGFVDLKLDLDATVNVTGNAAVHTEYKTRPAHITPNSDIVFSHPGIVSFKPTFDIQIGIKGDNSSFAGAFNTHFRTQTDPSVNHGWMRLTFPNSAGGTRGSLKGSHITNNFQGHMHTDNGNVEVTLNPKFEMGIELNQESSTAIAQRERGDIQARGSSNPLVGYLLNVYSPNKVIWGQSGVDLHLDSLYYSLTNFGDGTIEPWNSMVKPGVAVGKQPGGVHLHDQDENIGGIPVYRDRLRPWTMFKSDILSCPRNEDDDEPLCKAVDLCETGLIDDCDIDPPGSHRGRAPDHQKRVPLFFTGGVRPPYMSRCLAEDTGRMRGWQYKNLEYPTQSDWSTDDYNYDNSLDATDFSDCTAITVKGHIVPNNREYVTEHIMELQTLKLFFNDVAGNILPDGMSSIYPQIYCEFVKSLTEHSLKNPPTTPGSTTNSDVPTVRLMQLHGWTENWGHFALLEKTINRYKELLWEGKNPIEQRKRVELNGDRTRWEEGLTNIRTTFNVFAYLNFPNIHGNLTIISNNIKNELQRADKDWVAAGKGRSLTRINDYWSNWINGHLQRMQNDGRVWVTLCIQEMRATWSGADPGDKTAQYVLAALQYFDSQLPSITVNLQGLN